MFAFIKDFTPEEREYFWCPFPERKTVCRMSFSLRDMCSNEEIFQINCNSIVTDRIHAEIIAYKLRKKVLKKLVLEYKTDSSVLNFIISLNNSPCSECRLRISRWIKKLQKYTSVRLILFFSNLYKTDLDPEVSIIELFTDWILSLVEIGTVVSIHPIIVFKMVPEIELNFKELINAIKYDEKCIKNFRKLLRHLQAQQTEGNDFFSLDWSHDLFKDKGSLSLSVFTWDNPPYIQIYPNGKSISDRSHPIYSRNINSRQRPRKIFTSSFSLAMRSRSLNRNKMTSI